MIITNFKRLIYITWTSLRYNLLSPLKKQKSLPFALELFDYIIPKHKNLNYGESLCIALEKLGPIFIKIGQAISTRPDVVSETIANSLSKLRDNNTQLDFKTIEDVITQEFKQEVSKVFSSFEKKPIASASIAQVHQATTLEGNKVAVKIMKPLIKEKFDQDIKLMLFLARIIDKRNKSKSKIKAIDIVQNFKKGIDKELNFQLEASATSEMHNNLLKLKQIIVPKVYWNYSTEQILTTEWIDGTSIFNTENIIFNYIDKISLAKKLAETFLLQAFELGFFHADMHAGNIHVNKEGKIIFLDFGIVGRLSKKDRLYVAEILYYLLKQDYNRVAEIHLDAEYIPKNTDLSFFAQSLRAIGEPIIGLPTENISVANLLGKILKLTKEFNMPPQPQLILLQKNMILLEGIGYILAPKENIWELAKPWLNNWAIKNLSFEAKLINSAKTIFNHIINKFQ